MADEIAPEERTLLERRVMLGRELLKRIEKDKQSERGGFIHFVRYFWHLLEPNNPMVDGWAMEAICEHLEAVAFGEINRLLINVPPGFSKSMLTCVFFPAWLWGPMEKADTRFVSFSYASALTERDNARFRDIIMSQEYRELYGDVFELKKVGETRISNSATGWKLATSVGGVGTGERGDVVLLDDPHNIKEGESEIIRNETVRWFREAMSNRLNDMERGAIIVIMQRVHEADVSGTILSEGLNYVHLMIPMEFDAGRQCTTKIGWVDPRTYDGELAWPERFPTHVCEEMKQTIGPYAYTGQYQQSPEARGGSIFKRAWWQLWDSPDGKFPVCSYIIASLDPSYTSKQSNDPSGFTIWGVWRDVDGRNKIMLLYAWRKRLELHGKRVERNPLEPDVDKDENGIDGPGGYIKRAQEHWGLVEWTAWSCRKFKVDRLLVEAKASGLSVAQEIRRLYFQEDWAIELVNPKALDKVARAYAVQHLFADELIYAPDKAWADLVIDESASFPKGKYKDLVDSLTMALTYLRTNGLALRREEHAAEEAEAQAPRQPSEPLYDC